MAELKTYISLLQQVQTDKALAKLMEAQKETEQKLSLLMQSPNYDTAEAIRLTNDAAYLSDLLHSNPLYEEYLGAKARYEASLRKRSGKGEGSGCSCPMRQMNHLQQIEEET